MPTTAAWRAANRDRIRQYNATYRATHRDAGHTRDIARAPRAARGIRRFGTAPRLPVATAVDYGIAVVVTDPAVVEEYHAIGWAGVELEAGRWIFPSWVRLIAAGQALRELFLWKREGESPPGLTRILPGFVK